MPVVDGGLITGANKVLTDGMMDGATGLGTSVFASAWNYFIGYLSDHAELVATVVIISSIVFLTRGLWGRLFRSR